MSAQLPSVGDVFESVRAFKLACHRAALAGEFEIKALASNERVATLSCRLHHDATAVRLGAGEGCGLKLRVSTANGVLRVSYSSHVHTCDDKVRAQRRPMAIAWSQSKIRELEDPSYSPRRRTKTRKLSSADHQSGKEEEDSEGNESVGEESDGVDPFPSALELRKEVERVLKVTSVSFPLSNEPFISAYDLSLRLHAFAIQSGFTVYRSSAFYDTEQVRFRCSLNHSRYRNIEGGRCQCTFLAEKDDSGTWHVVESQLEHTHVLKKPSLTAGVERPRRDSVPPATVPPPAPFFSDFFPPSSSSDPCQSSSPYLRAPSKPYGFNVQTPQAELLAQPAPPFLGPFPPQLLAFLSSTLLFQPPQSVATLSTALLSLGGSSIGDLVSFFLLDGETLLPLFEQLLPVVRKETLSEFLKVVEEARRVARA
ncbi:hypothetical protein JCM6882_000432 [Rhodosporidiobolus microsporus]